MDSDHPLLFRLVSGESGDAVVLLSSDVDGFFLGPDEEPPEKVEFIGARWQEGPPVGVVRDAALQVVDGRGEVIGSYAIGEVRLDPDSNGRIGARMDGHCKRYPGATRIWREWAQGVKGPGAWRDLEPRLHATWLHVAQQAWFSAGRSARRYADWPVCRIDGYWLANVASFYCALGEAVNGTAGYFGSNLDALDDCLAQTPQHLKFHLEWSGFDESRERIGAEADAAVHVLGHHGITLELGQNLRAGQKPRRSP